MKLPIRYERIPYEGGFFYDADGKHLSVDEVVNFVNRSMAHEGWMYAGRAEDLPEGPPVKPGTKLYAFDARGTWTYNLPPLPQNSEQS